MHPRTDKSDILMCLLGILKLFLKSKAPPPLLIKKSIELKPSQVPSSKLSRFMEYGKLVAGLGLNQMSFKNQGFWRTENIELITSKLIRMRGAALKLGQMLSIQDNDMFPKEIQGILSQVQNAANYMPVEQLHQVLIKELGSDWKSKFSEFSDIPIAAASIGQVHKAKLRDGTDVAVKVQYPGVSESIDSDLSYLKSMVAFSSLLPKGLYLDNTIRVAQKELKWECDYIREAQSTLKFHELFLQKEGYYVPKVYLDFCTRSVLTTEWMRGISIGDVVYFDQETRDKIGEKMFRLCLDELFVYRFMQTDPNWTNFLYDYESDVIGLLDFGAAREYSKEFTDKYMRVLHAASIQDKQECIHWSTKLGFLTGMESEAMKDAHVTSLLELGKPFAKFSNQPFDFGKQSITDKVRSSIPTMLRERLTPPPDEAYSLHRKLSGCFLLCTKIKARVNCLQIFEEYYSKYALDS